MRETCIWEMPTRAPISDWVSPSKNRSTRIRRSRSGRAASSGARASRSTRPATARDRHQRAAAPRIVHAAARGARTRPALGLIGRADLHDSTRSVVGLLDGSEPSNDPVVEPDIDDVPVCSELRSDRRCPIGYETRAVLTMNTHQPSISPVGRERTGGDRGLGALYKETPFRPRLKPRGSNSRGSCSRADDQAATSRDKSAVGDGVAAERVDTEASTSSRGLVARSRNPCSTAVNSSGLSRLLACPASGITAYSVSGPRSARARVAVAMSPMRVAVAVDKKRGYRQPVGWLGPSDDHPPGRGACGGGFGRPARRLSRGMPRRRG
jgi:hypothetical protein